VEISTEFSPIVVDTALSIKDHMLTTKNKTISLFDVVGIKYGFEPIRLDMYTIGGRYVVVLKTDSEEFSFNFSYYFRINKGQKREKFNTLLNAIWDSTHGQLLEEMINVLEAGEKIRMDQCHIEAGGIMCKDFFIEWSDLTYQKNYNRLTINSKSNHKAWTNLYYTQTFNVHVLAAFLDWKIGNNDN
jgi:hypothetical protein